MDLLKRAKQKLGESKKVPEEKITPDNQEKKITPGKKVVDPQLSKSKIAVKQTDSKTISESELIDQKINEKINERLLKLLRIGVKHELTFENLENYIKTHEKKTKLYKLADYFAESKLYEIEKMLKYLYSTGVIGRDSNNWYYWKGEK